MMLDIISRMGLGILGTLMVTLAYIIPSVFMFRLLSVTGAVLVGVAIGSS